jgi:hypothetical protein
VRLQPLRNKARTRRKTQQLLQAKVIGCEKLKSTEEVKKTIQHKGASMKCEPANTRATKQCGDRLAGMCKAYKKMGALRQ